MVIRVARSRSSSGYFRGAGMLCILPLDQSLHQTRGDSVSARCGPLTTKQSALGIEGSATNLVRTPRHTLTNRYTPLQAPREHRIRLDLLEVNWTHTEGGSEVYLCGGSKGLLSHHKRRAANKTVKNPGVILGDLNRFELVAR